LLTKASLVKKLNKIFNKRRPQKSIYRKDGKMREAFSSSLLTTQSTSVEIKD